MSGSGRAVGRAAWRMSFAAAFVCAPALALAGAWTLPQGTGQVIATLYGWTGTGAPWGGEPGVAQRRGEAELYVQYGVTGQFTIFGQTALERYTFNGPFPSTYTGLDYSGVGLRARLWTSGEWVFSGEAAAFAPGERDPYSPTQAGNTGWAGEGRLLAGTNFALGPVPGFLDLEAGYRLRTKGPPDEWHGDATIGFHLPWGTMLLLQDFNTISMPSTDPRFPAWKASVGEASLVADLGGNWSLQIGWFQTLIASKTNTERGVAIAVWRDF